MKYSLTPAQVDSLVCGLAKRGIRLLLSGDSVELYRDTENSHIKKTAPGGNDTESGKGN